MKVNSTVTINTQRIKELSRARIIALEQTAEALHTEVVQARVMPRDEGTLQNEKTFVDYSKNSQGKVALVVEGPYARRLYFHPEFNFSKKENPNAGGKWLEQWLPGGEKENFCYEKFIEIYKRVGGV